MLHVHGFVHSDSHFDLEVLVLGPFGRKLTLVPLRSLVYEKQRKQTPEKTHALDLLLFEEMAEKGGKG